MCPAAQHRVCAKRRGGRCTAVSNHRLPTATHLCRPSGVLALATVALTSHAVPRWTLALPRHRHAQAPGEPSIGSVPAYNGIAQRPRRRMGVPRVDRRPDLPFVPPDLARSRHHDPLAPHPSSQRTWRLETSGIGMVMMLSNARVRLQPALASTEGPQHGCCSRSPRRAPDAYRRHADSMVGLATEAQVSRR